MEVTLNESLELWVVWGAEKNSTSVKSWDTYMKTEHWVRWRRKASLLESSEWWGQGHREGTRIGRAWSPGPGGISPQCYKKPVGGSKQGRGMAWLGWRWVRVSVESVRGLWSRTGRRWRWWRGGGLRWWQWWCKKRTNTRHFGGRSSKTWRCAIRERKGSRMTSRSISCAVGE